ncbi:MAG: hypothetical protein EPO67_01565 [Reyranella sp.]|jgi:hypothetical protein|nr:MAG: hypothetical protein EPO67_01565 [Reyranella sp.]
MDKAKANGHAKGKIEGEGSYSATADYNKRQADYLKKGTVDQDAQAAKRAIDSEEAASLKDAEEKGKSRAK